jgi:hypothetical protein
MALEELERPKARARTAANLPSYQGGPENPLGKTAEIVGSAVGISGATYKRAKAVVQAAEDVGTPEAVREVAQEALAAMALTRTAPPTGQRRRGRFLACFLSSSARTLAAPLPHRDARYGSSPG